MTSNPTVQVARVLPSRAQLTVGEVDAILEAAYLATAADGRLTPEENEAFRDVAAHLRGIAAGVAKAVSDADLKALFERFSVRSDHAERMERIAALRSRLDRAEARELAYKVAFAMSLCDLETNDHEAEYDEELIEAFGLSEERADALAGEVYAALDAETEET
jgi:tellurite resistance protein